MHEQIIIKIKSIPRSKRARKVVSRAFWARLGWGGGHNDAVRRRTCIRLSLSSWVAELIIALLTFYKIMRFFLISAIIYLTLYCCQYIMPHFYYKLRGIKSYCYWLKWWRQNLFLVVDLWAFFFFCVDGPAKKIKRFYKNNISAKIRRKKSL